MTEQERKIYDIQTPATKYLMDQQRKRSPEEDSAWWARAIPKEAQVRDEEGNVFINARSLHFEEVRVYDKMRREAGGRIAEMRADKVERPLPEQWELATRKNKAIDAFMGIFSVEVIKNKFKEIMGSLFKPSHAEMVAEGMRKVNEE